VKPERKLTTLAVLAIDKGRVAVRVAPPQGLDLQYIYRAALSVYWDPNSGQLEDRYEREESQAASVERISRALRAEYGLMLQPATGIRWEGIESHTRREIEDALGW
jgi:hypothetical protein